MFLSKRDFLLISFQEQDKPSKKTCLEFSLYIALVRFFMVHIFMCKLSRAAWSQRSSLALRIQLRLDRLKLQISSSSTFDLGLSCGKTVPAF